MAVWRATKTRCTSPVHGHFVQKEATVSTRCRFCTCVVGGMLVVGAMGLGMARPVTGLAAQPSRYVVGGSATDVVHAGELAYVVVADRLVPADVSNPLAPTSVGEPGWLGSSNDLAMGNGVIYAAQGLAPLGVIDLADPLRPRKIDSGYGSINSAQRVSVEGNRAWVLGWWLPSAVQSVTGAACDGQEILDVYDLTDPRAPRQIGSLAGGGRVSGRDLATAGDYAYVAAGEPRIDIYELRPDGVVPAIDSGPMLLAQIANVIAADGQVQVEVQLEPGYYEIIFVESGAEFGIAALPAFAGDRDPFFAIDSAMSWLVRDRSTRPGLLEVLRRLA
mgnify:CR=1 FL=1